MVGSVGGQQSCGYLRPFVSQLPCCTHPLAPSGLPTGQWQGLQQQHESPSEGNQLLKVGQCRPWFLLKQRTLGCRRDSHLPSGTSRGGLHPLAMSTPKLVGRHPLPTPCTMRCSPTVQSYSHQATRSLPLPDTCCPYASRLSRHTACLRWGRVCYA